MKRITAMLLMICLCLMGQSVLAEKKVGKIAVAQEPTKMDYWVGEEFSAEVSILISQLLYFNLICHQSQKILWNPSIP